MTSKNYLSLDETRGKPATPSIDDEWISADAKIRDVRPVRRLNLGKSDFGSFLLTPPSSSNEKLTPLPLPRGKELVSDWLKFTSA